MTRASVAYMHACVSCMHGSAAYILVFAACTSQATVCSSILACAAYMHLFVHAGMYARMDAGMLAYMRACAMACMNVACTCMHVH